MKKKKQQQTTQKGSDPKLVMKSGLEVVRVNVAGIDIGARQMHVCAPVDEKGNCEVRTFDTTTQQIEECARWLKRQKVESVAMESTGVYWIPVLEILESRGMETLLVDTRPMSRVPGRKTDAIDSQWIQTLHSHGLLQSSFRPSEEISKLRSLTRQKMVLVAEQADWVRRMHKCLDQMNVRVHHAVSDTQGVTGMAIIRAIAAGERDASKLAELRQPGCQKSKSQMIELLTGHWREDHLFNLEQSLKLYDALSERLAEYEKQIAARMRQLTLPANQDRQAPALKNRAKIKAIKRRDEEQRRQELYRMVGSDLTTIDGIGVQTVETIISEYGIDLSCFPTEKEFVAHLKLAPKQSISGGKPLKKAWRKFKPTRTGQALRTAAVTVGKGATALGAYYRRISQRKGGTIAVFATARKLATIVYRMLRYGQDYVDIGQKAYEERFRSTKLRILAATAAQFDCVLVAKTGAVNA